MYRRQSKRKELPMSPPNHDERIQQLVADFRNGYLTRRGFLAKAAAFGLTAAAAVGLLGVPRTQKSVVAQDSSPEVTPEKWEKGKGWGWVWGEDDELGNLNELSPELTLKALSKVKEGNVYDLGLAYDRRSYKFVGHSSGEIMSFRTPEGLLLHPGDKELAFVEEDNSLNTTWASNALFISDNVATQIDGFGHIYEGDPPRAYNGYLSEDIQSDFGVLKLGADTIPPIVAPATMIDVAASEGQDPLPESFAIEPDHLQKALDKQGVDIDPLDVVLVRTGTGGVWLDGSGVGANNDEVAKPDTAGLTVSGAKWLVEQKGALAIGTDTSGIEVLPPKEQLDNGTSFNPVHIYLLARQGVHILEYHNQEGLAEDQVYKFAYILGVNKIKGTVAGTVLRPIGIV
jgi:kynurenine formamidase